MLTLQRLAGYLNDYLESPLFRDYCPNGIQVQGREEVQSIATAVTASAEAIACAAEQGVDALLVHHGLFWERQPIVVTGSIKEKIALLLSRGLSLLAYHLPLDAHREVGNNWCAARALGLKELHSFGRQNGIEIGVQGTTGGVPIDEWSARVEAYYGQPARAARGGPDVVNRVGLVSGGAHRQLKEAVEANLDCFVTGTGDEPNWHMAHEEGIHFLAMGHAATERIGPRALGDHLAHRFGIQATFIEDANPF